MNKQTLIEGIIYGSALGDGWGYVTEFWNIKKIKRKQPQVPDPLFISDDTQMHIYTIIALDRIYSAFPDLNISVQNDFVQNEVRKIFAEEYVKFYNDPDNTRAPGMTCMTSLKKYQKAFGHLTGREGALGNDSLGCGTIMRSPWLGLDSRLNKDTLIYLAILQAQTTHDHEKGWFVSALASLIIHDLVYENSVNNPEELVNILQSQYDVIAEHNFSFSKSTLVEVWEDLMLIVETQDQFKEYTGDPCVIYGDGWAADEAFYTSFAVTLKHFDDPTRVIRDLVYTRGDSDSLASLGAAFSNAIHPLKNMRNFVEPRLEPRYAIELGAIAEYFYEQ